MEGNLFHIERPGPLSFCSLTKKGKKENHARSLGQKTGQEENCVSLMSLFPAGFVPSSSRELLGCFKKKEREREKERKPAGPCLVFGKSPVSLSWCRRPGGSQLVIVHTWDFWRSPCTSPTSTTLFSFLEEKCRNPGDGRDGPVRVLDSAGSSHSENQILFFGLQVGRIF